MSRHRAIEEKAIDWLIRKDEQDWSACDQSDLDAWLEESMANRAAYLRAEHGWAEAERVKSLGDWSERSAGSGHRPMARWGPGAIAASILVAVVIAADAFVPQLTDRPQTQEARFDTPVGERKIINLTDGSRIELNTRSVVRAFVDDRRRDVWLDAGEAYFEVTHREGGPFVVHAGKRTVTVLGTKFAVRRDGDRVTVNVLEGRVRVDDGQNRDTSAAIIAAGDTAIARGGSMLIAAKSEERVENSLAWRDGILTFNLVPLSEAASEFNRYNRVQLVVDPSASNIPIGGTFQAANVDAFARLLHDAYGLRSERDGNRIKISN